MTRRGFAPDSARLVDARADARSEDRAAADDDAGQEPGEERGDLARGEFHQLLAHDVFPFFWFVGDRGEPIARTSPRCVCRDFSRHPNSLPNTPIPLFCERGKWRAARGG